MLTCGFFELVGILKELDCCEIETMCYKDLTFGMNVLVDDKGALVNDNLCRVQLSVDIYIQHPLFEPEYYKMTS